jgi:zinc transporter 2
LVIWGLTVWLIYEAVMRIINKPSVNGLIMLITAVIGLICNLVMMSVLHERHGSTFGGHSHAHGGHGGHGGHGDHDDTHGDSHGDSHEEGHHEDHYGGPGGPEGHHEEHKDHHS